MTRRDPVSQNAPAPGWRRLLGGLGRRGRDQVAPPSAREPDAPPPANQALLSPRQVEVLRLLSMGLTNQQIARELTISEPTVATHVRHILQKTGAANRAEAAAFAVRHGFA